MRLAAAALILAGCANNDSVARTSPCAARIDCPNELTAPLSGECGDAARDPDCGASYQSYFRCRQSNQVCNGSGKLDEDASVMRCSGELDAYVQCVGPVDTGLVDSTIEEDTSIVDSGVRDTGVDAKPDVRIDAADTKPSG
jgi:hypothetical protein